MKAESIMAKERRQYPRENKEIHIEVRVSSYREVLPTRNISAGGLFVVAEDRPKLPVDTIVWITRASSEAVLGRITRVDEDGMGIELLDQQDSPASD